MHRRDFIKSSGLVTTSMLVPQFLKAAGSLGPHNGRSLVVLQLSGGNDGLNTVVPFRDDAYYNARPTLAVQAGKVLRVNDDLGLNPGMGAIRSLFDEGLVTLINGLGYPNPDRSHFRSMDIWHTASSSDEYLSSGWLGRFLDAECTHPHEVLEFGSRSSLAGKGERSKAISLTDPRRFHAATSEPYFARLAAAGVGDDDHPQIGYLYKTLAETYQSAGAINEHLGSRKRTNAIYPNGQLANQMRTIASFILNGLDTRVYYASTGGFDTHVNQQGKHERTLATVCDALAAFMHEMKANGREKDVLVMVFSEFGRRVKQNANNGTDHGTAGNIWLLGGALRTQGFYNALPSLVDLDPNGDLKYSVDFRAVYATLLADWLDADVAKVITPLPEPLSGLI